MTEIPASLITRPVLDELVRYFYGVNAPSSVFRVEPVLPDSLVALDCILESGILRVGLGYDISPGAVRRDSRAHRWCVQEGLQSMDQIPQLPSLFQTMDAYEMVYGVRNWLRTGNCYVSPDKTGTPQVHSAYTAAARNLYAAVMRSNTESVADNVSYVTHYATTDSLKQHYSRLRCGLLTELDPILPMIPVQNLLTNS